MKKIRDFHFKRFTVSQNTAAHKIGTDGVLLGAWVDVGTARRVLDIGTGTGVIALMLAQRTSPLATVDAVEIDEGDAAEARCNFERSPWATRITLYHSPIQEFMTTSRYDLIVTNPPYFSQSLEPPDDVRKRARHTVALSSPDLIAAADRLLADEGRFALILPVREATEFTGRAGASGLHCTRYCAFRTRSTKPVERLLLEFSRRASAPLREELVLYSRDEVWTEQYRNLTKDFYLER